MEKNILVPLDGSDASIQAAKYSVSLAGDGDTIIVLNVQKPQYDGMQKVGNISKEQLDAFYLKEAERILNTFDSISINKLVKIKKIVRIGLPAIEITKVANEYSVHSIVMGSKGMSPVVNNALGSVTYSVIHLATCPVTILPFKE